MFTNSFNREVFIMSPEESINGNQYVIHIFRDSPTEGFLSGFLVYSIYLTDNNPNHDILIGVGNKAFPNDGTVSDKEQFSEIEKMINKNIRNAIEKFDRIISVE